MRRLRRALAGTAVMLVLGGIVAPYAAAQDVLFEVTDERVQHASGFAADRDRQMYWTVNSGSGVDRALALRQDGSVEGTVRFGEAMTDAQAVYYIGSRLYIADIGDADGNRDTIAVHRFTEPNPVGQEPNSVRTFELRYSDGRSRDARSLLVGDDGQMFVITHEEQGAVWATQGPPNSSATNELVRLGDAPAWVTDAVFLQDGRIATRSYTSIEILNRDTFEVEARAAAPFQKQGEAMAESLDRRSLVLASSGAEQPVLRVSIPTGLADVPQPGPTPPASPDPTPTADPTPSTDPGEAGDEESTADDRAGGERTGTMVALLLAGALAVISAAVVYFTGGRRPAPAIAGRAAASPPVDEPLARPEPGPVAPAGAADGTSEDPWSVAVVPPVAARDAAPGTPVPADLGNPFTKPSTPELGDPFAAPAAAVPPVAVPPDAAAPAPDPVPRRALIAPSGDPATRRSLTIGEREADIPLQPRPRRASIVEPDHGFDAEGTWVRPGRTPEQEADDRRWLNRE